MVYGSMDKISIISKCIPTKWHTCSVTMVWSPLPNPSFFIFCRGAVLILAQMARPALFSCQWEFCPSLCVACLCRFLWTCHNQLEHCVWPSKVCQTWILPWCGVIQVATMKVLRHYKQSGHNTGGIVRTNEFQSHSCFRIPISRFLLRATQAEWWFLWLPPWVLWSVCWVASDS